MWVMQPGILYFMLSVIFPIASAIEDKIACSKQDSRIATEIVEEVFIPIFEDTSNTVPTSCPLNPARYIYGDNEKHKLQEEPNRWSCQYCGKAFVTQDFLDNHFDNRHGDTILKPPKGVCLGDYCDILRCEVVDVLYSAPETCNQTQLDILKTKCEKTVKQCVPLYLSGMKKYSFINDMRLAVCAYLTCEKYSEKLLQKTSSVKLIIGLFVGVSCFFGAIIFFLLVCTDILIVEPEDSYQYIKKRNKVKDVKIRIPGEDAELRHRHRTTRYDSDSDR